MMESDEIITSDEVRRIIGINETIGEKRYMRLENLVMSMNERLNDQKLDKQELWGHIHILEEQQEIMHNFLVEINKYLVNLADKDKK